MIKNIYDNKENAQQYPSDITKIVIPRNNYIMLDADYSQIEYRTLVAMAKEPELAKLFQDPDTDYHTLMASRMYGVPYEEVTPSMRSDAKSFNFGIPYGMGFKSLAILLTGVGGPTQIEEAKEKYELYFKDQPNVRKFFGQVKEMALVNKYTKTHWNRYRYYSFTASNGKKSEAQKASALRQAGNAVIQGCLHGETKIKTLELGTKRIEELVDTSLHVWDGNDWSYGDILYSGKKRKCIVTFNNGQQFICSPIHKFLIKTKKGKEKFVECQDLRGKNSSSPHRVVADTLNKAEWEQLGFMGDKFIKDGCLTVDRVEITDEYIDMYDVCNTDGGYYVADGIITHNTAADIFKISVARNFMWIRKNNLYGDVLITNMIHDEQLIELNCDSINVRRAVGDIVQNMQFDVDGFPPLYVGAGIGSCWKNAKGKMAEMHPNMVEQLIRESQEENEPLRAAAPTSNKTVLEYFDNRVYEFRVNKIREYIENPENWGKTLHPVIGALIEQQFTYGLEKELSGKELGRAALAKFIEVNNVNSSVEHFVVEEVQKDAEKELSYDDDGELDVDDLLDEDTSEDTFTMMDESDKFFGVSIQDIIKTFGLLVSTERKVCGIDVSRINVKKREELVNLIVEYQVDEGDPDSMQVVFLQPGNILFRTAVWVKGITDKTIKDRLGIA